MGVAGCADYLFTFHSLIAYYFIFYWNKHTHHTLSFLHFLYLLFCGPYKYTHYHIFFYHLSSLQRPNNMIPKLINRTKELFFSFFLLITTPPFLMQFLVPFSPIKPKKDHFLHLLSESFLLVPLVSWKEKFLRYPFFSHRRELIHSYRRSL
jgi:hypothetical protein